MNPAAARLLALALLAVLLSACAGRKTRPAAAAGAQAGAPLAHDDVSRPQAQRYRSQRDGGPATPIDVHALPEPVPKSEPRSRYGNPASYSVLGKTYTLLPDSRGYVARGTASWYGEKFHGYRTSSFEPYDMYAFSAAHKTLPLPTYARVTNLDNGQSVIVRINDRGPFHGDRLIDLSWAAAARIGVWPRGTAPVEVRVLEAGTPPLPAATRVAALPAAGGPRSEPLPPPPGARVYLQLGAFGERANAERALRRARRAGLSPLAIDQVAVNGRTLHRVRLGPLADPDAAGQLSAEVSALGLGEPRLAIEAMP